MEYKPFKFNVGDVVKVRDDILDSGYYDDGECVEGWAYEAIRKYHNLFHITKQISGRGIKHILFRRRQNTP